MNKARITYRFDRDGRQVDLPEADKQDYIIPLYEEDFQVVDEYEEPPKTIHPIKNENTRWNVPYNDETDRLEKMIRESGERRPEPVERSYRRTPSRNPSQDQTGGRTYREDEPYHVPVIDEELHRSVRYGRSTQPSWLKIFITVTGAIVTGAVFGFLVLSMFTADQDKTGTSQGTEPKENSTAVSGEGGVIPLKEAENGQGPTTTDGAKPVLNTDNLTAVDVQIEPKSYYMLQYGVFSTQDGAQTAQEELRQLGLAAASQDQDMYRVYAGISDTKDNADAIKAQLESQVTEVYAKPVELPAANRIYYSGAKDEAESYFNQGAGLMESLIKLTLVHLAELTPGALDAATVKTIQSDHQAWTQLVPKAAAGLPGETKALQQKMNNAVNTAVVALDQYNKNPSTSMLWQVQSSAMSYILAEKELLETIGIQ